MNIWTLLFVAWVAATVFLTEHLDGLAVVVSTTVGLLGLCLWAHVMGHNK